MGQVWEKVIKRLEVLWEFKRRLESNGGLRTDRKAFWGQRTVDDLYELRGLRTVVRKIWEFNGKGQESNWRSLILFIQKLCKTS